VPGYADPRWLNPAEAPALFWGHGGANAPLPGVLVVADAGGTGDSLIPLRPGQGGHALLQLHGRRHRSESCNWSTLLGCPAHRHSPVTPLTRCNAYSGVVRSGAARCLGAGPARRLAQRIPLEWLAGFPPLGVPWGWRGGYFAPDNVGAVSERGPTRLASMRDSLELCPPGDNGPARVIQL